MSYTKGMQSGSWLFLAAVVFMFIGVVTSPIFIGCSIVFLSVAEYQRNKVAGAIGAAAGLAFMLLLLGYGLGKDLALRDNLQTAAQLPSHAP